VLKITIQDEPKVTRLRIEGRIVGPWVAEFDRTWRSLASSLEQKKLAIDLCGVTYIDEGGKKLLADIYEETRAQFEADTPLTQYFVQEAMKSGRGNGKRKGART
jgi:ABC-type transporter Mla MlaB component